MGFASTVQRLTEEQKIEAMFQAEIFARDNEFAIVELIRDRIDGEYWAEVFAYEEAGYNVDDDRYAAVDIVRCPNCNSIQACWGQYGDPESEILLCTECHKEYEYEI